MLRGVFAQLPCLLLPSIHSLPTFHVSAFFVGWSVTRNTVLAFHNLLCDFHYWIEIFVAISNILFDAGWNWNLLLPIYSTKLPRTSVYYACTCKHNGSATGSIFHAKKIGSNCCANYRSRHILPDPVWRILNVLAPSHVVIGSQRNESLFWAPSPADCPEILWNFTSDFWFSINTQFLKFWVNWKLSIW